MEGIMKPTIEDLLDWEEEEHQLLPFSEEEIAQLEEAGYIVDLVNGDVFRDPDAAVGSPATIQQWA